MLSPSSFVLCSHWPTYMLPFGHIFESLGPPSPPHTLCPTTFLQQLHQSGRCDIIFISTVDSLICIHYCKLIDQVNSSFKDFILVICRMYQHPSVLDISVLSCWFCRLDTAQFIKKNFHKRYSDYKWYGIRKKSTVSIIFCELNVQKLQKNRCNKLWCTAHSNLILLAAHR